jgi:hypothetical protein
MASKVSFLASRMDTTLIAVRTSTSSSSVALLRGLVCALYIRFTSLEGAFVFLPFPLSMEATMRFERISGKDFLRPPQ